MKLLLLVIAICAVAQCYETTTLKEAREDLQTRLREPRRVLRSTPDRSIHERLPSFRDRILGSIIRPDESLSHEIDQSKDNYGDVIERFEDKLNETLFKATFGPKGHDTVNTPRHMPSSIHSYLANKIRFVKSHFDELFEHVEEFINEIRSKVHNTKGQSKPAVESTTLGGVNASETTSPVTQESVDQHSTPDKNEGEKLEGNKEPSDNESTTPSDKTQVIAIQAVTKSVVNQQDKDDKEKKSDSDEDYVMIT